MGGAIANLALRKRPDLADRVVYITPMFEIEMGPLMKRFENKPLEYFTGGLRSIGLGSLRIGGGIDSTPNSLISGDRKRIQTSYLIEKEKGVRTPKASIAWVNEALKSSQVILGPGKPENASLIFNGEYDPLVRESAHRAYACSANNCGLIQLAGAHALHQERDPVRQILVEQIDTFFQGKKIVPSNANCREFFKILK
jgi:alpha-beta hydrolase superfamily lysophospholipase